MSCNFPLKAFTIGKNPSTGKDLLKVCSYKTDHLEKRADGKLVSVFDQATLNPFSKRFDIWQEIPCGQCIACRLDYSRQWANRCALEMKYHKSTMFVTLTYDDKHLPTEIIKDFKDPVTGEIKDEIKVHSLVKSDMQSFMKNLRSKLDYKIRFFGCGEYGDKSARPHLHLIIFGLDLDDLVFYKTVHQNGQYYNYYNSNLIDSAWQHKGFCVVTPATWETVAYTARYVTKKLNGNMKQIYDTFHLQPEFVLMSRKPGIGYQFFDDNKEKIFTENHIIISNLKGSRTVSPPRYFKKALENLDPDWYNDIKLNNKEHAEIVKKMKLEQTSLSYLDYLVQEDYILNEKITSLQRDKV